MKTVEVLTASPPRARRAEVVSLALSPTSKITASHLERLAIVYVRQSSQRQVRDNRESTDRQYGFAEQAVAFGWSRERVLTIDEDLGKSGRTTEGRGGFQRLVGEVTLNHVGMVLGLEMSRLARSSKDWHSFFEMCAIFGTLITDEDGVYDGNDPNDRLLLGLKGIMSEMELHMMRNRLEHGRLNKARRGELFYSVPFGYVKLPDGKIDFDPDEQARSVVHLLFEKYDELGSVRRMLYWMVKHGIRLPIRPRTGPNKGQLDWRRPSLHMLTETLHHPMYAGAYSYGRGLGASRKGYVAGQGRKSKRLPMEEWEVLLWDRLPAYITRERYLKNLERMKQNQSLPNTAGSPRKGCALLTGLLICGHCGSRMQVQYPYNETPYYRCLRAHSMVTEKTCKDVSGKDLDELVSAQVLRALEPAALELSVKAQTDLRRERERLNKHWKQNCERARYDAESAQRRYQAVDPMNRLVAATLERQWEEALARERELKEEYDRFCGQALPQLSADDEARIANLASDIPALWHSATTTNADRKAIVRCLVERVVVIADRESEHTVAAIQWMGGFESRLEFVRRVRDYTRLADHNQLLKRLSELHSDGKTAEQAADVLNAEGFHPVIPRRAFNRNIVRNLLLKLGLHSERNDGAQLGPHEWWIRDLASEIGMPWQTLRDWATKGWAHGRQTNVEKLWVIWADRDEVKRLRKLRTAKPQGIRGYSTELTEPKRRP
jgi:DNA invertase Pin-like site-specific DNA recombinase